MFFTACITIFGQEKVTFFGNPYKYVQQGIQNFKKKMFLRAMIKQANQYEETVKSYLKNFASYNSKSNDNLSFLVPSPNQIFAIQQWSGAIAYLLKDVALSKTQIKPLFSRDLYLALVSGRNVLYAKKYNFDLKYEIKLLHALSQNSASNETNEFLRLIKNDVYEPLRNIQDLYKQVDQYIPMPTDLSLGILNSYMMRNALRFFPGLFRNTVFQINL